MAFWERLRKLLRGEIGVVAGARAASTPRADAEQLAALEGVRRRMAELAASIGELEQRARQLEAERADGGELASDLARGHGAADPRERRELIDGMLTAVRHMTSAVNQQREYLQRAEQRLAGDAPEKAVEPQDRPPSSDGSASAPDTTLRQDG